MPRVGGGGSAYYSASTDAGWIAVSGSGTNTDPWRGYAWINKANFNTDTVTMTIPSMSIGWVRIKSLTAYYVGAAGVKIAPRLSLSSAAGAGSQLVIGGFEHKTTAFTNDTIYWSLPAGLTIGLGGAFGTYPGLQYYDTLTLATSILGYAATDDIQLHMELEWSQEPLI